MGNEFRGDVGAVVQGDNNQVIVNMPDNSPNLKNGANLIDCPECTKPVSRSADPCPHCGFNVREYFGAIHHEQVKKRLARVALGSVGFSGLGYALSVTFPQMFGAIGLLMMPVGLFCAMAALKAAEIKP